MNDAYIQIRVHRNTGIAVLVSLLVHVLLLFLLSRQDLLNQHQPISEQSQPMTVNLGPRTAPKPAVAAPAASVTPLPSVAPLRQVHPPKTQPLPVRQPETPKVIATVKPEPTNLQQPATPPKPAPLDPSQFPDMMSYLNAVRGKRNAAGGSAENSELQPHAPSEDEARMANIKRNLQQSGTNGVFQISSIDAHTAVFSFRGWKNEYSYSHREVYQVDVGMNDDIERAVVRKMIEIIRRYYTGDFNWESPRLGRVVVLSARLQDNDGLEDFMIQEFFATQGISAR